ncbi:MAG: hypothetical protein ACSNEK_03245 [Parachlamydiaceae bacterium]
MFFDLLANKIVTERQGIVRDYLKNYGYQQVQLNEINEPNEHGSGFYYTASTSTQPLFVKITPRVPNEIGNLHFLMREGFDRLTLPTCFGTSAQHGILIMPVMEQPRFFVERCNQLQQKQISNEDFILSEKQVLKGICSLHSLYQYDEVLYPKHELLMRASARHLVQLLGQNHPLLRTPMYLEDDGYVPSLYEMIEKGICYCSSLPPIRGRLIHGECSHTNVGRHQQKLIFYDFEKMRIKADPSWDLAKWIKYFHYFYFVQEVRKTKKLLGKIEVLPRGVLIKDLPKNFFPDGTDLELLSYYADQLSVAVEPLQKRVNASLFLSCLFSLHFSLKQFPYDLPIMLRSVIAAYETLSK